MRAHKHFLVSQPPPPPSLAEEGRASATLRTRLLLLPWEV